MPGGSARSSALSCGGKYGITERASGCLLAVGILAVAKGDDTGPSWMQQVVAVTLEVTMVTATEAALQVATVRVLRGACRHSTLRPFLPSLVVQAIYAPDYVAGLGH
ncbi:hypothetical protein HPB47_002885 [Ixodes persulcatus]|uniref:Uncharacterized protein n=1 Tax=Ixodes persulcatus TaxID=34615 RepID=A0AC60PKE6_IXOPE|nr:hypothetical protein HPB47_002885 [Ixodes persulcatus]